jgi:hypothetical protein
MTRIKEHLASLTRHLALALSFPIEPHADYELLLGQAVERRMLVSLLDACAPRDTDAPPALTDISAKKTQQLCEKLTELYEHKQWPEGCRRSPALSALLSVLRGGACKPQSVVAALRPHLEPLLTKAAPAAADADRMQSAASAAAAAGA